MNAYRFALDLLHFSGAARMLRGRCAGAGALLTLHHVRPPGEPRAFSPNSILDISPGFLESAIVELRNLGYEFISLDEFHARMTNRDFATKFVSFTLDDGYIDNYLHAYPVFRRHKVPFAIYVCSGIMDRTAHLWWRELEEAVWNSASFAVRLNGTTENFGTGTVAEKYRAFNTVYWRLRAMPLDVQMEAMQRIREQYPCDFDAADSEPLTWEMIDEMQASGLLTIGGHTVSHHALSKLDQDALREEIRANAADIEQRTGALPRHFAYPYGDRGSAAAREFQAAREFGFATAVTTRKGVIVPRQASELMAVPRISLNGHYQRRRYLRTLMTGVPTAMYQQLNRREATC